VLSTSCWRRHASGRFGRAKTADVASVRRGRAVDSARARGRLGEGPRSRSIQVRSDIGGRRIAYRTARRAVRARVTRRGGEVSVDEEDEIDEPRAVGGAAATRYEAGAAIVKSLGDIVSVVSL